MTDAKNEIVVYDRTKSSELIRPDEMVTARNVPAIVKAAGKAAGIGADQARTLLKSIDFSNPVGLRDRAALEVFQIRLNSF